MTFLDIVMVGIGGFFGAVIRFEMAKKMNRSVGIPAGTLAVNWIGALLIGLVFGLELSKGWTLLLASGLAGALTTFSTLNKELIELWRNGEKKNAICYLVLTYGGGVTLAALGYFLVWAL